MLLSIIIPCYNSARFISNTLDMLISQGLSDCEVIVVNDGSTDDTSAIVHSYVEKNPLIKIVDKENGGVSDARNVGLKNASSDFIYFMDSDDTLKNETLDFYRKTILNHPKKQMYLFGYEMRRCNDVIKIYSCPKFNDRDFDNELLTKSFFAKKLFVHICSCIYERKFLLENNLYFTVGHKIGEDIEFTISAILKGASAFYSSRVCFVYQLRDDSAMAGYKNYIHSETLDFQKKIIDKYGNSMYKIYFNYWLAYNYVYSLKNFLFNDVHNLKYLQYFKERKYLLMRKMHFNFKFCIIKNLIYICPLSLLYRIKLR